ncbi:Bacterial cellulose synthase subunit [Mycolicibacterium gilvum]|uniref:Bacterial cellulose synthase subunit n=1 Tax=Mycolicibacterium gilvum TaxID=1804 RepID=A0A378SF70_9MYCO|nr:Bacterial cellulose synthase subunit [Mycolicibacterium gilvum]
MRSLIARAGRLAVAIALVASTALTLSPTVHSIPGSSTDVGWTQLGLSNQLELVGVERTADVQFPVPPGVTATRLTGRIGSVIDTPGRVDILDREGTFLGSIPIPPGIDSVPFAVDISRSKVVDNVTRVRFALRGRGDDRTDSCTSMPAVTLTELRTTYSGEAELPRTVADFLPGYLERITVALGPDPGPDEQQAALTLVAQLTRLYRPIPVRIAITTDINLGTARAGVAQRTIVVRRGDTAGISVDRAGTPEASLVITGTGDELERQVSIFADRRFELAQTPDASVDSTSAEVQTASYTATFGQLGMAAESSVLGMSMLYLGFDATSFAVGSIDNARIRLMANHTPVVSGDASVLVRSGGAVVASHRLDESGLLDLSFDVPREAVSSSTGFSLELRYNPQQACAPLTDRITFVVDPRSTVSVDPGNANRGGFPVLPMAFSPDFDVSVDRPENLRFASQAINLMGQQTTTTLRPRLIGLTEASQRGTGWLMVGPSEDLATAGVAPPMLSTGTNVNVEGVPVTDIDIKGPLGVVQAFTHNDRVVLALDAGDDPELLDESLEYVWRLENRWATLTGDTIATGSAGTTVNLALVAGGPILPQPDFADGWKWWIWLTVSVGAVAAIAVCWIVICRLWRRRGRTGGS